MVVDALLSSFLALLVVVRIYRGKFYSLVDSIIRLQIFLQHSSIEIIAATIVPLQVLRESVHSLFEEAHF